MVHAVEKFWYPNEVSTWLDGSCGIEILVYIYIYVYILYPDGINTSIQMVRVV